MLGLVTLVATMCMLDIDGPVRKRNIEPKWRYKCSNGFTICAGDEIPSGVDPN
jgi:hypothetical protein